MEFYGVIWIYYYSYGVIIVQILFIGQVVFCDSLSNKGVVIKQFYFGKIVEGKI